MAFKIEICGNINKAGFYALALERLGNRVFVSDGQAIRAVHNLAAAWCTPQAIWDIVAVVDSDA